MPLPAKVKATHDYESEHPEEDLTFSTGQIITVTEEVDEGWYAGFYTDESGVKREGLFPQNHVEKYEPAAPPRPTRPRPKSSQPPPQEQPAEPESSSAQKSAPIVEPKPELVKPAPAPVEEPAPQVAPKSPEIKAEASKSAKPAPPPVAEKPSSFKDRIAAFNKASAAPIAPGKPGGAPGNAGFVKKPFVAPPPARNSYVPPIPKKEPSASRYVRSEDPEIAEQRARDLEQAEQAGVVAHDNDTTPGEEAAPSTSLKDRIAALRKQQEEQAARKAEKTATKPPARKPSEPTEDDEEQAAADVEHSTGIPAVQRRSTDEAARDPPPVPTALRRGSLEPSIPETVPREMVSDENDADQSGAGETTEDGDGGSTEVENEERPRPIERTPTDSTTRGVPPPLPKDTSRDGDEEDEGKDDAEQEVEEEEDDPEVRRKNELRQRMAKMSGGMGFGNVMFGGPPGGMPGAAPKKSKPPSGDRASVEADAPPPQRIPVMPIPGMASRRSTQEEEDGPTVAKEPESRSVKSARRRSSEVPDVEELEQSPVGGSSVAPVPQAVRPSAASRGAPPVPGNRPMPPAPEGRPPPPARRDEPESDEEPLAARPPPPPGRDSKELPTRGAPPVPGAPVVPSSKPEGPRPPPLDDKTSSGRAPPPLPQVTSPVSPTEKRDSRVPPVPGRVPTMPPPQDDRPPPPPPPTAAPPSRQSTTKDANMAEDSEEDQEYDGDYDTDIGSSLRKAHEKVPSDEITLSDAAAKSPAQAPPVPPPASRAAPPPPPPPHQAPKPRSSVEAPRAPPPVPSREAAPWTVDDDYDPYKYDTPMATPSVHDGNKLVQESDPALYAQEHSATSPPLISPPQLYNVPPPLPPQHQTLPKEARGASLDALRPSADVGGSPNIGARASHDQQRSSVDRGQMAVDIPLDKSTPWWTYPNTPPPPFQHRSDLLTEYEESTEKKRNGPALVKRTIYVLFPDYSQTEVTATFDSRDPNNVDLNQTHRPPPPQLRQHELEGAYSRFGAAIASAVPLMQNRTVGDGSPWALVQELFRSVPNLANALPPVGIRAFGALVYANMANASTQQHDEIRAGDIISFRNAKFQGKHGTMHAKYTQDVGDHVGVVSEWDGTKKKVHAFEQGRDSKKKVNLDGFRMGDLRSGEVKVWRVVGRGYVDWDNN